MPYRRTTHIVRKQAARHQAIIDAARAEASEGSLATIQVATVAERAGIATGTVYRYFPSKTELVAALIGAMAEREVTAIANAGKAAPGPLSALAAAIATFAARVLRQKKLSRAMLVGPAEADVESVRIAFRRALADEFQLRITAAMQAGYLPAQDVSLSAAALLGALLEGLLGPAAYNGEDDPARARDAIQALTLFALRALGVVDARARGLVVQIALPVADDI